MCSGARGHSSRPGALKKQRVLALHGYQQDANSFRAKTGALRKALLDIAEINYIDAPHSVPPGLTWWRATKDGSEYNGFTDSLAHVRAYIAAEVRASWSIAHTRGNSNGRLTSNELRAR